MGGALTLSIMVLPLILRTTEEALRSVSDTYREGSFGLGSREAENRISYCTAFRSAGILAGSLAIGRIVGETAALLLSSRHGTAGGRWAVFIGAHAGGTHVCPPE